MRLIALVFILSSLPSYAIESFSIGDLTNMTNAAVTSLVKTVAIGADHHAYMPATPLGYTLGLDIGIDATAVTLPSEFTTALQLATQASSSSVPSLIPVPKLSIHKGLPLNLDLGFSFIAYQSLLSIYGGEVKWAVLDGSGPRPALAVRSSLNFGKIWFLSTRTYSFDVLVSKKLFIIDPYFGFGLQIWAGDLVIPAGTVSQLPVSVSASQSSMNPRLYVGMPLKLGFFKLTGEFDYSFAGITTFGGKVSFAF